MNDYDSIRRMNRILLLPATRWRDVFGNQIYSFRMKGMEQSMRLWWTILVFVSMRMVKYFYDQGKIIDIVFESNIFFDYSDSHWCLHAIWPLTIFHSIHKNVHSLCIAVNSKYNLSNHHLLFYSEIHSRITRTTMDV